MSDPSKNDKRKLYFFGFRWHAPVAVLFAMCSLFSLSVAGPAVQDGDMAMFIPIVIVFWGFGFYFSMSAIMVDEPMLRFIGLMSFAVLEWGCFALMTTVSSTVSHPLFRALGF